MPDRSELAAGYKVVSLPRYVTAAYRGVLRRTRGSKPSWTCACPDYHASPVTAARCAERELARRGQGGQEVFTLLRCEPCRSWWDDEDPEDGDPGEVLACPRCGRPLARLKLVVAGRGPAVDAAAGQ